MTTTLAPKAGRHCQGVLNPIHSTLYFSPDLDREFGALGFTDTSAMRLAARSAPLGAVGAGTVAATFYNYNHELLARHLPAVWETASPAAVPAVSVSGSATALNSAPNTNAAFVIHSHTRNTITPPSAPYVLS